MSLVKTVKYTKQVAPINVFQIHPSALAIEEVEELGQQRQKLAR